MTEGLSEQQVQEENSEGQSEFSSSQTPKQDGFINGPEILSEG